MTKPSEDSNHPTKKSPWKRRITLFLFLIVLVVGAWYTYKIINPDVAGPRIHPLTLIPANTQYVLETDRPYELWTETYKTRIWKVLEEDEEWAEYGEMMSELESSLSAFDQALNILANRTVYISQHVTHEDQTDLLFIIDFEGLGFLETWMENLDHVTKRVYKGQTIFEKLDMETKETLYFSIVDSYLIASFTHTLVESSLESKIDPVLHRSFDFIEVRKKVLGEGLMRIYINYQSLFSYLHTTLHQDEIDALTEGFPFLYGGSYMDIHQTSVLLKGYSNYEDSITTYLNLFNDIGHGDTDISTVLPSQTSMYVSFGFDSFSDFYKKLSEQLSEEGKGDNSFETYTKRTEKFLRIDLEKDLADWIDDEIALAQFELNEKSETALVIKAKSSKLALEKMSFLSRQIKKRTPVRFKTVTYRNQEISYMAVKGLFNLVLGKLFSKVDRPYYTIIDEYVIFSSGPESLRNIIDHWYDQNTLADTDAFKEFISTTGEDHNILFYSQLDLLSSSHDGLLDSATVSLIQTKSHILSHFPQFGFTIQSDGKTYKTQAFISIYDQKLKPSLAITDIQLAAPVPNFDSLKNVDPGEQIEIKKIEIEDLGAKRQSKSDSLGNTLYDFEIKNGMKNGHYFEYYPTGELKIKGKYKSDLKDGTWKYYSLDGKLEKKEKYKKGELIGQ